MRSKKEYINLCRDQVLAQKRMMGGYLNGYVSGMASSGGGMGGATYGGGMGGATFGGGMGAFGAGMGGAPFGGGMGGAPFGGGIGGMGASMGGGSFSTMLAPICGVNNGASSDGGMGSYMSNEEVPEDGDVNNGREDNA
jgi:hypothetical protein